MRTAKMMKSLFGVDYRLFKDDKILLYDATSLIRNRKVILYLTTIPALGYLSFGIRNREDQFFYIGLGFFAFSLISVNSILKCPSKIFLLKNLQQVRIETGKFLRGYHSDTIDIENISSISKYNVGREGYKMRIDFHLYKIVFDRYLLEPDIFKELKNGSLQFSVSMPKEIQNRNMHKISPNLFK